MKERDIHWTLARGLLWLCGGFYALCVLLFVSLAVYNEVGGSIGSGVELPLVLGVVILPFAAIHLFSAWSLGGEKPWNWYLAFALFGLMLTGPICLPIAIYGMWAIGREAPRLTYGVR